jgi:hypothetical protein
MPERFFRDVACRAGLSERERAYLGNIFGKATHIALKKLPSAPNASE